MPAWSQLDQRQRIAVFQCEGGGVRLAARFNDKRKAATSVVAQILTVRSRKLPADSPLRNSPFLDKTKGFQHSDKLVLDGRKYDYSYGIVRTDKTVQQVYDYLTQHVPILRHDPAQPYADDNIRVDVDLIANGDLLPMTAVFTKMDIYNLAVGDDRPSQRWRAKYSPFDEPKEFFWGSADGEDLQSIVDEYTTALAPNATF